MPGFSPRLFAGLEDALRALFPDVVAASPEVLRRLQRHGEHPTETRWSELSETLNLLDAAVSGDENLVALGAHLLDFLLIADECRLDRFQTPLAACRTIQRSVAPVLFPVSQRDIAGTTSARFRIRLTLPRTVEPCRAALLLELGLYQAPSQQDPLRRCELRYRAEKRGLIADFVVRRPNGSVVNPDPDLPAAKQPSEEPPREQAADKPTVRSSPSADMPSEAKHHPRPVSERQLESFVAIGQRMAQMRDIDSLAASLLDVVIHEFRCEGGMVELTTTGRRSSSWETGVRRGPPDIVYPLVTQGEAHGSLSLWGADWAADPRHADPIASLLPWIAVAFDNAVAFHELHDEKKLSDARARELEKARINIAERDWQYQQLIEEASDAIAVIRIDSHRFVEVNRALCEITGYSRRELLERSYDALVFSESDGSGDDPSEADDFADLANKPLHSGQIYRGLQTLVRKDGGVVEVEFVAKRFDDNQIQLIGRDMSRWKQAQQRLRESEERYALAVRGANDGLWDWNLRTAEVYYSPRWKLMLGYEEDEIGTSPDEWFGRVHREDLHQLQKNIRDHIDGKLAHFEVEYRIRHKNGRWRWMHARGLAVCDDRGDACRVAGSQTDIHERKRTEHRLYHNAFHDSLTGLPNRAFIIDALQDLLDSPRAARDTFAVLYLDLDRFKVVNDSLGHAIGDRILTDVGERLSRAVGFGEIVARLGGDEFTVLLPSVLEKEETHRVADRIRHALREPFFVQGREVVLSASIGIAYSHLRRYRSAEEIIRDADMAMYQAKARGNNRFETFDETLHHRAIRRMELESDLRKALHQGSLELYYQPLIDIHDQSLRSFEALTRWNHPELGRISPAQFVPLAEESGLVSALGRWALREASAQYLAWAAKRPSDASPFRISVNVSPRHFRQPGFVEEVLDCVDFARIPDESISIEITESALVEDSDENIRKIERLREEGFRVVIDDFGVGYSSFNYLVRLPINDLKIDRSFVFGMEFDETKYKVVTAIVNLARSIGVGVVAEGVETSAQLRLLRDLDSDMLLQGAHYSMPVPADHAVHFFDRQW